MNDRFQSWIWWWNRDHEVIGTANAWRKTDYSNGKKAT